MVVDITQQLPMLIDSLSQDKYNELFQNANLEVATSEYWINKIKGV